MIEFLSQPSYDKYGLSGGAATGKFFFVGAMALDMEKLRRLDEADTVANEVRFCLNRLQQRLQARGLGKRDIVRLTCYITDQSYREDLHAGIREFFGAGPYPATFEVVAGIAVGCRVELEALVATGTKTEFFDGGASAHGYVFAPVSAPDGASTVAAETRACLDRLQAILAGQNLSLGDLVKVNAYLAEDRYRTEFWDAYKQVLEPGPYPARCTWAAGVAPGCRVQLDAVAVRRSPATRFLRTNAAAGVSPGAVTGHLVYASALAIDIQTMKRVPEAQTVADETRIAIKRLESVLAEAGCTLRDVAKTTCFVRDEAYRFEFVYAYKECFDPGPYPSRASYSLGLAGDCRVQIDAVAVLPDKSPA
jgi:2-iminobutanoate/2-iminopropanoate deaminase